MLKNITLSADANIIKLAREKAHHKNETLNAAFQKWLIEYAKGELNAFHYSKLMKKLKYANSAKRFTRDQLNER